LASGEIIKNWSALLFAGKGRKTVGTGCYLALFNAGLAGSEFRTYHKGAAPAARIAGCILPAPVSNPVFHGTHHRGMDAAGKIEAVTGGKPADGLDGGFRRNGRHGRLDGRGSGRPAGGRGTAGGNKGRGCQKTENAEYEGILFHQVSLQLGIFRAASIYWFI
jgi:hypothetical protein